MNLMDMSFVRKCNGFTLIYQCRDGQFGIDYGNDYYNIIWDYSLLGAGQRDHLTAEEEREYRKFRSDVEHELSSAWRET